MTNSVESRAHPDDTDDYTSLVSSGLMETNNVTLRKVLENLTLEMPEESFKL